MDQNLTLDFGTHESEHLRRLLQRMGEFIAIYETSEVRVLAREEAIEKRLADSERRIQQQLDQIRVLLSDVESIMTEAGVARWRIAAENALKEGKSHALTLEHTVEEFKQLSKESLDRLDRATAYTIKGISEALSSFRVSDFRQHTDEVCRSIQKVSETTLNKISRVTTWLYWRKTALVMCFSVVVAIFVGLYIDNEWPWESHARVNRERVMGEAVLHSWNNLSPQDQQTILQHTSKV